MAEAARAGRKRYFPDETGGLGLQTCTWKIALNISLPNKILLQKPLVSGPVKLIEPKILSLNETLPRGLL